MVGRRTHVACCLVVLAAVVALPEVARSAPDERAASAPLPATSAEPGADVAELRTRTSRTYKAEHGSYELQLAPESINYQDDLGRWLPIDNRLAVDGDVVRNGANRYAFTAPRTLGSGGEIRVRSGGSWVGFVPRAARGTAQVDGTSVTYEDAWPGVDLRYTATGDTVREEMILADRASARDFQFDLRTPAGVVPQPAGDGVTVLRDGKGTEQLRLSSAWMVDAAGARAEVASQVVRGERGWSMRITPDRTWLRAPERRWPVSVDPTVVLDGVLGCTIVLDEFRDDEESYCGEGLLVGEGCTDLCKYYRTLVRFDLEDAIPPGGVVEFATLTGAPASTLGRLTTSWNSDVTWTSPDGGSSDWSWPPLGGYFGGASEDWEPIADFTQLVRDWIAGTTPNYGLFIADEQSGGSFTPASVDPGLSIQYAVTDDPAGVLSGAAVGTYVADEGISTAEAQRRMRIQDRISSLQDDLEGEIAAADFGGLWIDDADAGRPKIGIKTTDPTPPAAKTADAEALLADHDLEAEVDFVSVDENIGELEAAAADITDDLDALVGAGKVAVSVDVAGNRVEIETASTLTAPESAQVTAAASGSPVDTTVTPTGEPSLAVELKDDGPCTAVLPTAPLEPDDPATPDVDESTLQFDDKRVLVCEPPFRGGMGMVNFDGALATHRCTPGFWATKPPPAAAPRIVTAGHCLVGVPSTEWKVWNLAGTAFVNFGVEEDVVYPGTRHDVGTIRLVTSGPGASPFVDSRPGLVFVTSSSLSPHIESYEIRHVRVKRPPIGRRLCITHAPGNEGGHHTTCGVVRRNDYSGSHVDHAIDVRTCRASHSPAYKGEQEYPSGGSGGPVYKNHVAYGIGFGGRTCRFFYEAAAVAEDLLDVEIAVAD